MQKKQAQQYKELEYPCYKLLPWEVDWATDYAYRSTDRFKNLAQLKDRTQDKKFLDALTGAAGELAFREMLCEEWRGKIKEWSAELDKLGCPYDFLFDNGAGQDAKIDVKTAGSHSAHVHSPEECNFFYSKETFDLKVSRNIELCDQYIQIYYDIPTATGYFIGAVTLPHLRELEKTKSIWNGGFKVLKSEMNWTAKWLPYLKREVKLDYRS